MRQQRSEGPWELLPPSQEPIDVGRRGRRCLRWAGRCVAFCVPGRPLWLLENGNLGMAVHATQFPQFYGGLRQSAMPPPNPSIWTENSVTSSGAPGSGDSENRRRLFSNGLGPHAIVAQVCECCRKSAASSVAGLLNGDFAVCFVVPSRASLISE